MSHYLFLSMFSLALCAAFVWLAVRHMRAGKPHRVFVWLARFFGVMVVMGVDSICKAEGIILRGLVVVAGAVMVLMIVSGVRLAWCWCDHSPIGTDCREHGEEVKKTEYTLYYIERVLLEP